MGPIWFGGKHQKRFTSTHSARPFGVRQFASRSCTFAVGRDPRWSKYQSSWLKNREATDDLESWHVLTCLDHLDLFGANSWLHIFELAVVDAIADAYPKNKMKLMQRSQSVWQWHLPWYEVRGTYLGGRSICTFVVQTWRSWSHSLTMSDPKTWNKSEKTNIFGHAETCWIHGTWVGQRSGTGLLGVGCEAGHSNAKQC